MHLARFLPIVLAFMGGEKAIDFDWERDRILLTGDKEKRGVVLETFDPRHVVLLREGGRREELPLAKVERLDTLRMRLADFMGRRKPDLTVIQDWALAELARDMGLRHMARLQAYHVLTRDPKHAGAHELLGHLKWGKD